MDSSMILNYILSLLLRKIVVPADFHNQVEVVHAMFRNDMTGLVDVLTDFAVQSANVDYRIEAENDQLNTALNNWLQTVNVSYGKFPMGIKSLAKEYMQERWKSSSFMVLQIAHWKKDPDTNLILPDQMVFVDGGSIHAIEKDKNSDVLTVDSWDYYLGKDETNLLKPGTHIMNRPYTRWFDKYPIPYTIKRGIYYNYKIIESLKKKEIEVLDQIIPYMMLITKGSEALSIQQQKTYSQPELQAIVEQMQQLYENLRVMHLDDKQVKTPIRVTNFDEQIKHLIPDLKTLFQAELFEQAERNILSGLGFIDIVQGVVSNRRESVLNPKAFIQEINSAVEDFKLILQQLLYLIAEKNSSHVKYNASRLYISASPITTFMTDEFKTQMRLCYERGNLSKRTYTELVGEGNVDYETEKFRRAKEEEEGDQYTMFPQMTQNMEQKGIEGYPDNPPDNPVDKNGKEIPQDRQGAEKKNWNYADLEDSDDVIDAELVEADADEDILELAKQGKIKDNDDTLLYIVRHGKTKLNSQDGKIDRIRGWKNPDLDEKGVVEAKDLAKRFDKVNIGKIYSSDLNRAVDTAEEISKRQKKNIRETKALRPMHLGEFEGQSSADVAPKLEKYIKENPDEKVKDGESFNEFSHRFLDFLNSQIETASVDKKNILVTHYRGLKLIKAWLKAGGKGYNIDTEEFIQHDPTAGVATTYRLYKNKDGYGLEEASYKVRETEQYIRYRQQDPSKFEKDSFRTIVLSPSKGIKAIIGRLHGKKTTTVQAYLFRQDKWDKATSKVWVNQNHPAYSATVNEQDLVTAPYNSLAQLPPAVKKLSTDKQKHWRGAWNGAYRYMLAKGKSPKTAETYAFRVAWSSLRKSSLSEANLTETKQSIWERIASKFKSKK